MKRIVRIAAVVCFAAAAIGIDTPISLLALGLFLYALAEFV